MQELVPHVDRQYRTRAESASRGIAGDFFGAYAALKVPMLRPGVFGAAYALHPVGTGTGTNPGYLRPDWKVVHEARTWQDLTRDTYAPIFVAMAQAYLPNSSRPPFFCDFLVESLNGRLEPNTQNIIALQNRFHLDSLLPHHAEALKQLRGLKIDWGRYDSTYGHVHASRALSLKMDGYAIPHFSEEYAGNQWDKLWVRHGRIEADLLPFFAEFLEGAAPPGR